MGECCALLRGSPCAAGLRGSGPCAAALPAGGSLAGAAPAAPAAAAELGASVGFKNHVKVHTSIADVREATISDSDRSCNAEADDLAKAGASFHAAKDNQKRFVKGASRFRKLLLTYIAQFEALSLAFCTSCCKYSDTGSHNRRGLDHAAVGGSEAAAEFKTIPGEAAVWAAVCERLEGAAELRALLAWRRWLGPLEAHLPDGLRLDWARPAFMSDVHVRSLDALMRQTCQDSQFFCPSDRGCFGLLAVRTSEGVVGAFTDFPWRSRASTTSFGQASSDSFLFSLAHDKVGVYPCRSSRRALMRFSGSALELGPEAAPAEEGATSTSAALALEGSLARVRSSASTAFGSPALVPPAGGHVAGVVSLSWAHLEGESIEEMQRIAHQQNQNTFLLNFIGSSVRSQMAAKGGSAWS
ncbi:unnamed protein product [Prorocentrum cordatum]|uniref:TLDc domain-containing protein n=1 Tax=Prorocentrum cordatum TaxID=2364126 RepID=A0ABN9TYT8_9DINO|nr:unnamed protein product [Polarella glacialis]